VKSKLYLQKKRKATFALETIRCSYNFKSWVDGIRASNDTIEIVFDNDLKTGLRFLLYTELKKVEGQPPFIAFNEKENVVYYFTGEKWNVMNSGEYFYLVNRLSGEIYNYYTEWRKQQTFTKAEEKKHVKHYFKICGEGNTTETTILYIKKWMYSKVKIEGQIDDL